MKPTVSEIYRLRARLLASDDAVEGVGRIVSLVLVVLGGVVCCTCIGVLRRLFLSVSSDRLKIQIISLLLFLFKANVYSPLELDELKIDRQRDVEERLTVSTQKRQIYF